MIPLAVSVVLAAPHAGDVAALADPSWAVREAAFTRLARAGPVAMPAITAGAGVSDPEVAERCRRLLADAAWRTPAATAIPRPMPSHEPNEERP